MISDASRSVMKAVRVAAMLPVIGLAACDLELSPPDLDTTRDIVTAVAEWIAGSTEDPVVVAPIVGVSTGLLEELAFDDRWEAGFLREYPDLPTDLFERGRRANRYETIFEAGASDRFGVVSRPTFELTRDSVDAAAERLSEVYGPGVRLVAFAQPAVSAGGDEALIYYMTDDLLPMGRATWYAYLTRREGSWSVRWRLSDYVE